VALSLSVLGDEVLLFAPLVNNLLGDLALLVDSRSQCFRETS
jgi:hypothetical protein